jgi:phospholipid transport system substrate-binding protein
MMMSRFSFISRTLICSAALVALSVPAQAVSMDRAAITEQGSFILASAGKEKGAEAFVGSMAKRALDFLGNTQQTPAQKAESFRRLLEDNFDMETIGRFTLGTHWRTATPAQRSEYQKLFKKRIVEIYSQRFSEYKGQKFETAGVRSESDTDSLVKSYIIPADGSPKVQVDWRVRHRDGRYRIVDVVVEGVSMSVTQRSDFSSIIQRGGGELQALLDHLKKT